MDDGFSGSFTSLIGYSSNSMLTAYTVTKNIYKGRQHRFKYRAKNFVGWGPFSSVSDVLAATVPKAPDRPLFSSFNNGDLIITIPLTEDNGGSAVTNYELEVDAGDDFSSDFNPVPNYSGQPLSYTSGLADGLVLGRVYRFRSRAVNIIGKSLYSREAYIAYGDVPAKPDPPIRIYSDETTISVQWTQPAITDLQTKGYILNMDDGQNTDLVPIYIGR